MQVECGHCKKRYNIADENAGKQFSCRACGQRSPVVPIGAAPAATDAAAAQAAARPAAGASTAIATKTTISVACPKCGKQYQNVPAAAVGKPFKCKACQQVSPIRAAPARPAGAATVRKDAAVTKTAAPARPAAKITAAKSAAVAAAPAMASAAPASPLASDPLGPYDPLGQDMLGGSSNLLDLLGDAPLPGSTGTPLTSSPLLAKPIAAEPPKNVKTKKKKKKSGDSAMSDHVTVMLRMMGGGFLALCGLGLIVWGIVIISNPDDERWSPGRAIRCFVGGVSLIGGGLKAIVG